MQIKKFYARDTLFAIFVETVTTVKTVATMIYNAIYLAITLHYSRKLIMKLRVGRSEESRKHLMDTLMCLRNMPPDETVVLYRNGHKEPLKMPASSAANYVYAKLTDLGRIPI